MWSENEEQITRITMQVGDVTTKWEVPYTDCNIEDLLTAFTGLLVSHTWLPVTIFEGMKNYAEDELEVLEVVKPHKDNEDLDK